MRVKGYHLADDRPVEAVACVIDRSGSMSSRDFPPTRLQAAIKAVAALIDAKQAIDIRDRVAVVAFNERAHVVGGFETHRATAWEQSSALQATGTTNIHDGLALAFELLKGEQTPGLVRRIVLLSDGAHNTGPHPENLLPSLCKAHIIVDAIAIGTPGSSDYDEPLLRMLAERTGGEFVVVQDVDSLIRKYRALAQKKRQSFVVSRGSSTSAFGRIRRIR